MDQFANKLAKWTALLILLRSLGSDSYGQANAALSIERDTNALRLTLTPSPVNGTCDILCTSALENKFAWQPFLTGAVGQATFCFPQPTTSPVYFKAVPHDTLFADITTDASTNPTTTQLVLRTNQNAFRVWTGEQDVAEPYFDLFVKINGVPLPPVRLYRWQSRILSAPLGAAIALGTVDGRGMSLVGVTASANLETPAGVTNTAWCDAAGPPLWSPAAPQVVLPGENMAFSIASPGYELPVFISEYDGVRWTPPRFVILETNVTVTIRATFRYVALANYAGVPLTVIAPSNSVVGGVSTAMSLPGSKGRVWLCTNTADFTNAVSKAVAGEQIVLADGVYELDQIFLADHFTANMILGNIGPEGITIRSASGNRDHCVLTGVGTNGGWNITGVGMKQPALFQGVTFNFSNMVVGFWPFGGKWRMQDVRFTGRGPCDGDRAGNVNFRALENDALQVDMLRVQCDNSDGRAFTFSGVQNLGVTNAGSRVRLVDCTGFTAGSNFVDRVLLASYQLPVAVYGGDYSDAQDTLVDASYGNTVHCFWTRFSDGARVAHLRGVSLFGCIFTTGTSDIEPQTNSYVLFSSLNATYPYAVYTLIYAATDGQIVSHNRLRGNAGRALWSYRGGAVYEGNILEGWTDGILAGWYSSGSTNPVRVTGNTFVRCARAMEDLQGSFRMTATNNACFQSAESSVYLDTSATNLFLSDFNVYDALTAPCLPYGQGDIIQGWIPAGPGDILQASAALDSRLKPTSAGNCATNGVGLGRLGDSDPWGHVLYYTTNASRGARARPVNTGVLLPDVW